MFNSAADVRERERVFTFMCRRLRLKRSSSLCWRAMKLTAAYSSRAENTKSRQTAIQISMAFT